ISMLLTEHPDAKRGIQEIVLMGGAYGVSQCGYGNVTPAAEFNIYSDPEAAKIVFESGLPLKAVGLDVTSAPETWLTQPEYSRIKASKSKISSFAARILANTMAKRRIFELHDPITIGAIIQSSLYKFDQFMVAVETKGEFTTGMTIAERRHDAENEWTKHSLMICTNLKAQRFKRLFLSHIMS
ncbi:MAG TPA: nucleoside hydrolase, partial [Candidatus Binatus sp.]|nr:nucleoside hydrolase [Candidatus Binatus sp.]